MMDEKTKLAILLGIIVPSAVVLLLLIVVYIVRKVMEWYRYGGSGYNQVNHELDEEEIEFKRILEVRHGRKDVDYDYETLFNGKGPDDSDENVFESDDFSFNAKERDRLSILEQFRNNLVAEASSSSTIQDNSDEKDLESSKKAKLNIRIKDKSPSSADEVKEVTGYEKVGEKELNSATTDAVPNPDDILFNAKEIRALQSFYDSGSDSEMQL